MHDPCHDTAMTVLMGFLVAAACGWIGCYLILQGMALVGDAISHTVLLGIVGRVSAAPGQVRGGDVRRGGGHGHRDDSAHRSACIRRAGSRKTPPSASSSRRCLRWGSCCSVCFAGKAHIDTQHVLYGNLEFVASGPAVRVAGIDVPEAVLQMAVVAAVVPGADRRLLQRAAGRLVRSATGGVAGTLAAAGPLRNDGSALADRRRRVRFGRGRFSWWPC